MKKLLKYWLPPVVWAALFFPLGNVYLSKPWLSRFVHLIMKFLFPGVTSRTADSVYILLRKSMHFFEYAVLAFLIYRAFRSGRRLRWNPNWAFWAAAIAIAYGLLDESLQMLVPGRNGSLIDWAIDAAGALSMIGLLSWKTRPTSREKAEFWREARKGLFLKRPFDVFLSGLGLILSSPLWLALSLMIWFGDRGPIFYLQERVGRGGRVFKAIKFRSMIRDAEKDSGAVQAVENDPRVTMIGRIMRSTAMDELPQLVNIFKGDMSFVGPRALRPEEKEVRGDGRSVRLDEVPGYKERLAVRPGLTGLAQVYLPTDAPRRDKFRFDRFYIHRKSLCLDLELMFLSFWITFRGKWESRQKKV